MDHSRLAWFVRSKAANRRGQSRIEADSGTKVVIACLSAIRRLGEANGARVHILAHRRANQVSSVSDPVWRDFLEKSGAADITDVFQAAVTGATSSPISFDGVHWSAEGNRRMASVIQRSLRLPQD